MRTTKGILLLLSALLLTGFLPATVFADNGHKTYQYLLGVDPLCSLAPDACPDVSSAPNGDTVAVAGMGTFDIRSMTATGSGTFVHTMADGTIRASGTWQQPSYSRSIPSEAGRLKDYHRTLKVGLRSFR